MHLRLSPLATCLLCLALTVQPSTAQAPPALAAWTATPTGQADALYFAGQAEEAFELLKAHLLEQPDDYEALWRVARSTLVVGVSVEGNLQQNLWFDEGMRFADRAVSLRPKGIEGRYWRGAVTGRRALNAAAEYGAELAQTAYEDALAILEVDPHHGGAHNILGKIYFEIMSMSRIERWLGRTFVRTDVLRTSSWERAEHHLETAAESWPDWVVFQYDLAELYRKRGREDEAREAYARVVGMPSLHPSDPALQRDAELKLEDLGD
jgi:tetratricopeptide (TPR) repeat protein